jgi:hypothetical protein
MSTEEEILKYSDVVAMVGLSSNPERPSHIVARVYEQKPDMSTCYFSCRFSCRSEILMPAWHYWY